MKLQNIKNVHHTTARLRAPSVFHAIAMAVIGDCGGRAGESSGRKGDGEGEMRDGEGDSRDGEGRRRKAETE